MKKNARTRLKLNRETVRKLEDSQLGDVAGAYNIGWSNPAQGCTSVFMSVCKGCVTYNCPTNDPTRPFA